MNRLKNFAKLVRLVRSSNSIGWKSTHVLGFTLVRFDLGLVFDAKFVSRVRVHVSHESCPHPTLPANLDASCLIVIVII